MRLIKVFRENKEPSYRFAILALLGGLAFFALLLIQAYGPNSTLPEKHKQFYFWFSLFYVILVGPTLALLIYRPHLYQKPYLPLLPAILSVGSLSTPQLFYTKPAYDITATVGIMGMLILFLTNVRHGTQVRLIYFLGISLLNVIVYYVLNPHFAYLEPTPMTHGPARKISFLLIIIALISYAIYFFGKMDKQRQNLITEQGKLIEEIKQAQVESEARRLEAEARYAEAQRLQKELAREVARTTLTARYEALMRDQYGKPLPDFLRALLEYLHDDLNFVAGLAYQVKDETYEAVATFSLPQYQGRTFTGGLLQTATALKAPYLVAIPPLTLPLKSLATLKPRYALYLPIRAEVAQGKVVALTELLFINEPDSEKTTTIGELLPRLGTFIWMQSEKLNIYAE